MSLRIQLTIRVYPDRNQAYQQSLRKLAEKAATLENPMYWTTYETRFGAVGTYHIMSERDYWLDLAERGNTQTILRDALGERKGRHVVEDLTRSIAEVRECVKRPRPELSYLPAHLDGSLPMVLQTIGRARLGAAGDVEELIRAIALAIPKIDDRVRLVTHENEIGEIGVYSVARWVNDEADLDRQPGPLETLQRVHGEEEGRAIWQRGMSALESAERWILFYRQDLSHPQPAELGLGPMLVSI